MGAMVSQINSLTIVYLNVYSSADKRKHQSSASLGTGDFPAQMASNAENVPFDDVIVYWQERREITNIANVDMGDRLKTTKLCTQTVACSHANIGWKSYEKLYQSDVEMQRQNQKPA